MGRFRRVLWWGVHATTVLLVLLMVFSYMPNSWVVDYKHKTGKAMDGVFAQYVVWSGRAECTLVFDDYDREKVQAARQRNLELKAQGKGIDASYRRDPEVELLFSAMLKMRREHGVFALPKFQYEPKTVNNLRGRLHVSMPISYPLLLSAACSMVLIWSSRRRIPEGCCQSCGYALEGLTTSTCPECGITIVTIG